jgi:hypothetical protein
MSRTTGIQGLNTFTVSILFAAAGALPASAHQSYLLEEIATGTGALLDVSLGGQWGLSARSPLALRGDFTHSTIPYGSRDDAYRWLAEGIYDGRHFGLKLRHSSIAPKQTPYLMTATGITVSYRFVTWASLSVADETFLSREDRKAEKERLNRERKLATPVAPVLYFEVDFIELRSTSSAWEDIPAPRGAASVQWKLIPDRLTLWPRFEWFSPQILFSAEDASSATLSTRSLRLVRLGPDGPLSGIFGLPKYTLQMFSILRIDSLLWARCAITRASLHTPPDASSAWSFFIGFERMFGRPGRWAVSPSYEHILLGERSYSILGIQLRRNFSGPYLPD